jgi:hypothetical protein
LLNGYLVRVEDLGEEVGRLIDGFGEFTADDDAE